MINRKLRKFVPSRVTAKRSSIEVSQWQWICDLKVPVANTYGTSCMASRQYKKRMYFVIKCSQLSRTSSDSCEEGQWNTIQRLHQGTDRLCFSRCRWLRFASFKSHLLWSCWQCTVSQHQRRLIQLTNVSVIFRPVVLFSYELIKGTQRRFGEIYLFETL